MRSKVIWALVGANIVLAAMLSMHLFRESEAVAQVARPSEYLMIPGEVAGGRTGVVYVVDTTNGLLGAMAYDDANRAIAVMPPLDLNRVFAAAAGGGGGGRRGR